MIVIGPGRCGSSGIAGVLHHLGVHMGYQFKPANEHNPRGYFEDLDLLQLVNAVLDRKISLRRWNMALALLMAERRGLGVPWGWKHPALTDTWLSFSGHLLAPKIVRCTRDRAACIASLIRAYKAQLGWTDAQAEQVYDSRTLRLDHYLVDYDVLTLAWEETLRDPAQAVERLVKFATLEVTDAQRDTAVQFLAP